VKRHGLLALFSAFFLVAMPAFSQPGDTPGFMAETSGGYAIGVDLDHAGVFGARLLYPLFFGRLGLALEVGGLFGQDNSLFHASFGPMMFIDITPQWSVVLNLGLDYMGSGTTSFIGVGGGVSVNRRLGSRLYVGANLGIAYAFLHRYNYSNRVFVGYETNRVMIENPAVPGTVIVVPVDVPVYANINEDRRVFGNRFHFRPSLLIGVKF